nr:hypothetical protein CFP56_33759 [Quercus suber]
MKAARHELRCSDNAKGFDFAVDENVKVLGLVASGASCSPVLRRSQEVAAFVTSADIRRVRRCSISRSSRNDHKRTWVSEALPASRGVYTQPSQSS